MIVKTKLESTPQSQDTELPIPSQEQKSVQEDKIEQVSKPEADASKPKTSDEKPLTESQIKAIEQLPELSSTLVLPGLNPLHTWCWLVLIQWIVAVGQVGGLAPRAEENSVILINIGTLHKWVESG